MLAGAGLGDDPPLAHAHRQQHLAEGVVDLVGAGVVEVFALEVDLGAVVVLGQPLGKVEGAGPTDKIPQQAVELGAKLGIPPMLLKGFLQLRQGAHQGFRHKTAPKGPKPAPRIRTHLRVKGIPGGRGSKRS